VWKQRRRRGSEGKLFIVFLQNISDKQKSQHFVIVVLFSIQLKSFAVQRIVCENRAREIEVEVGAMLLMLLLLLVKPT